MQRLIIRFRKILVKLRKKKKAKVDAVPKEKAVEMEVKETICNFLSKLNAPLRCTALHVWLGYLFSSRTSPCSEIV